MSSWEHLSPHRLDGKKELRHWRFFILVSPMNKMFTFLKCILLFCLRILQHLSGLSCKCERGIRKLASLMHKYHKRQFTQWFLGASVLVLILLTCLVTLVYLTPLFLDPWSVLCHVLCAYPCPPLGLPCVPVPQPLVDTLPMFGLFSLFWTLVIPCMFCYQILWLIES